MVLTLYYRDRTVRWCAELQGQITCAICLPSPLLTLVQFFFNFCEATWVFTTYTFATLVSFVATHGDVDIDPQIIVIIAL